MPVYTVVITKKPNVKEQEAGTPEKIVHGPDTVVAANEAAAIAQAAANAAKAGVDLASPQIHIEVRAFQ
jgi:hypothetical protein